MKKRVKTAEIKFYCEPELKERIEETRGLVSLSAWMRDAARLKILGSRDIPDEN